MRAFFCACPAFVFTFPLGMIGLPFILCVIFFSAIFGFGWQVTNPANDLMHLNK